DIELFHTAVLDFDAYVEAYEFLASYNNELVHRGDSNWDNVIDVSDVDAFFVRHGLARGDYNLDGSVGGADWTVWQDNFNKVDAKFQEGDGNFNGVVDAADYAVWYDNVGVTVVPSVPMASFQVSETSPAGPLSVVKYATSEASTSTYPVLTLTSFPDAIIKDFRSEASELRVDYNVVYAPLISLSVEIIARTESTDQILMTHPVTAGGDLSVGHHEIAFAANFGNDPNEDYELYARLVPTFVESEQSTLNNELLFAGGVFVELDGTWQAFGSSDHDVISLSIDAISITGESATEELTGLSPPDPVKGAYARGGSGDDAIVVKPDFPIGVTVYGGAGNDTLVGGNFVDTIHGGDGADVVVGMGGNDFLYGDTGNDLIHTDGSNNSVFGGDGDDEIHSESPSDLLNGGSGTDSYVGDTIGQVTDESGDRQVFRSADGSSVNVTQSGPVILAIGNPTVDAISDAVEVRAGTTVYLDVWAHDTDGDNISYSLRNLPSSGWGTYLPEMDGNGLGSINWTAPPQTAGYPTSMTFEVVATSGFSPALEDSKSITFNLVDHPWQAPYTLYDHPGVDGAPTTHDKEFFIRRQETGTSTPIVIDLLKGFGEADFYNSVQSGNSTLNEPFIRIIDDTGQTLEPEQIPQIVEWDFLEDKTRIENGTTIQEPYQDVNVSERTLDFGQIKYVPTPGFLGLDVIEYELTHDTSNGPRSNTAKIYINVEGVEVQNVSIEYPWRDNAVACACTCSCTLDGKMKVEPTSANIRSSTPLGTVNASYRPDYAEEIVRVDFRYYYGGRVFSAIDLNYKMEFLSEGASELQPVLGHIINNRTTDNNELGTFYFSVNTPNIPSGVYKYQLDTWIQTHASEPDQSAHFVTAPAWITLVRPDNVGIGKGWTIGGSEQLLINPDDADGQILWIRDDGYILTFPFVGGPADRDPGYSMLSKVTDSTTNITTYVITDKFGNEKHFDGNLVSDLGSEPFISGLLLKKRDTYGNELEFGWSPNIIEEPQTLRRVKLSTIQNSYDGRQYHVDYDSGSSYASQMREVLPGGGTQTFGFNYSAGSVGQLLSTITYPDPDGSGDGGGPEVSPTALFGYDDDRLTSYTNPDVFSEDFSLKGDIISRSIGGEPSRHTVTPRFQPYSKIYAGLKVGALQGIYYDEDVSAPLRGGGISDEYGRLSIYDVNGSWISQIIDPAGRMFVYDYNSVGQVERSALYDDVTGGLLDETIYGYDDHYNLETVTHFDGSSVRWKYDTFSRPTEYTDELGRRTTFVHQYEGTTPKILQTIVRHEMPADGSGLDNDIVVTYDYSTQGELSSITQYLYNPLTLETKNIVTGFAYGGPGRSLSETVFAAGTSDEQRIVYQDFDTQGNPQEVREYFDATSFRTTALEYDALNRVTSVTLPAPGDGQLVPKVTYDYWPSGRLKTQTETDTTGGAGSVATRYDYHFGDLSKVTRDFQGPDESATEYLYNYVGEVWATIDPLGQTTNYIYDRIDQLIATVSPDPDDEGPRESSREFYGYDRRGDNVFVLDPRFNLSAYSYDARHRLTGVFGPHFSRTFFTYDPAGQMLHLTDAEKRTTSYEYDAAGRPIRITRPEQLTSTLFTFDTLHNTVAVTDELDRELRAEYDDRNRLTLLTQNYGSGQPELEHWVKYAYYRDGNLDWSEELVDIDNGVDVTRITTYQYDGAGRLKNEVLPEVFDVVSGTLSTPIWNYKYDERGNVAKITDPLSNQR
ncbi:MAG: hypothetical protein KDA99_22290, partial [Planctomycetales bacterium]|nr:hypothetical protein [Planctomycetales bacterium]